MSMRNGAIRATEAQIQQGGCECPCRRTRQQSTPPQAPNLLDMTLGERALAFARRRTNVLFSADHRPPTSPANTTNRALARHKLRRSAFFPSACCQRCTIHMGGTWTGRSVAVQWRIEGGIHRKLPPNKGRPSAMISNLRPLLATGTARSKSLNSTLVNPGASFPTNA